MKPKGIVLLSSDKNIGQKAGNLKLPVTIAGDYPLPYSKVLFVGAGVTVPWDLLPAGWHFLNKWDCACPLWRYGVNASQIGSKAERKRTREIVRDLRVPLYAVELLFVRNNEIGRALVETYAAELKNGDEPRLAFLRAYYQVKPRLCALPRSWMAEVQVGAKSQRLDRVRARKRKGSLLVPVEVRPGVFVQCNPGQEEQVREMYAARGGRR